MAQQGGPAWRSEANEAVELRLTRRRSKGVGKPGMTAQQCVDVAGVAAQQGAA